MTDFVQQDLTGARFHQVDLTDARFEQVNLSGGLIRGAYMDGFTIRAVDMNNVVMRGVGLFDVDIYGDVGKLTINGVDVGQYVNDELDRKYPDRAAMRPTDAAGFREAWDVVERLWAGTVERARGFTPDQLHESVGGEWSFIQTLRHLVFATESWVHRMILGDPSPWHPLSLPWDEMRETPGVPRDREARPSLDEVLELRRDRMATVRRVVDELTDESLAADTKPVDAPGWPPPQAVPVHECLSIVLNEEWEHRLYAERDLTALEAQPRA
jgi:hypothetical protein